MIVNTLDAYLNTADRVRCFLLYHDGLVNTRARRIRTDWKRSFLSLMHWPQAARIERVDGKEAVLILRDGASLSPSHFTQAALTDQLRAALTFGVSALDRYVHERVVKGIIPALRARPLCREQLEFELPATAAVEITAATIAARRNGRRVRPANILRRKIQDLLHKRPFQSFREIDYAFRLLGVTNLAPRLQASYGIGDISRVKSQLNNIAMRRNQIVHEGDLVRHERGGKVKPHDLSRRFVEESLDFIDLFVWHLENVT